jgi:hypothetical protein
VRYHGDEAIASTGNVDDVSIAAQTVTERLSQGGYVDFKISFLNEDIWPNTRDQIFLADNLAGAFDQARQNFKGATADLDQLIGLHE